MESTGGRAQGQGGGVTMAPLRRQRVRVAHFIPFHQRKSSCSASPVHASPPFTATSPAPCHTPSKDPSRSCPPRPTARAPSRARRISCTDATSRPPTSTSVLIVCHALLAHRCPSLPVLFCTAEVTNCVFTGQRKPPPRPNRRRRRLRRSRSLQKARRATAAVRLAIHSAHDTTQQAGPRSS